MSEIIYHPLTDEQKAWLKAYRPADERFTSFKEMDSIFSVLQLGDLQGEELRHIRNSVVLFYSEIPNYNITALWSVTAAIDYYRVNHGISVVDL